MEKNYAVPAEEYYTFISQKNVIEMQKYLHPDVEFQSPVATLKGKEAVVEVNSKFMNAFSSLTIQTKFGNGNQAMVVYTIDLPGVAQNFPGASLLTFREGLIASIQLFFDGSRMMEKKKEVFSQT